MALVWRKISQRLLMALGTLSLLVVITGMSAEMPRNDLWTLKAQPLSPIKPQPFCSDRIGFFKTWDEILNLSSSGQALCRDNQESHYEKKFEAHLTDSMANQVLN
jgi:hypothetical protein